MTNRANEGTDFGRRQFLVASAAAGLGLVIGFRVAGGRGWAEVVTEKVFAPNAFVRVAPDGTVTVLAKHIEFGQGTYTGLASLVAEELDADWSQMRAESAPADASLYNNLHWGPAQGTGGSSSIANSFEQYRTAGATARAMLAAAAAEAWGVPAAEVTVEAGIVRHPASGRSAAFGALAERAAKLAPPEDVQLKSAQDFKLIGTRLPRLDSADKSRGRALYTIDVKLPGMLTAVVARPPRFGGRVRAANFDAALAVDGVEDVVSIPRGLAVLANGFWPAIQGRDALSVEWDDTDAETRSSDAIMEDFKALADRPGAVARQEGEVDRAIAAAATVLEATYEFPYLAHTPMEPLDCVVRLENGGCEIWAGSQAQTMDQMTAAAILGIEPHKVTIHTMLAGGSFGRRATPDSDVVAEAVSVAKAIGGKAPVKVVWTREDDVRGGRYRPMSFHALRAGLDADGRLVGWHHRIIGQSILKGTPFEEAMVRNGIDHTSVEGAYNLPHAVPHVLVDLHTTDAGVPVLWWRAVGSTHNAYAVEAFLDEIAQAAGRDTVEFRLELLAGNPRHSEVLKRAAAAAGWGDPVPEGVGRGVAVAESFGSYVAQVADVRVRPDGGIKVERVVCAVDCGLAVNPDVVRAQMEGGIGYGLGAILHNELTLDEGHVVESNFHDFVPLRIDEMPAVDVHIVESDHPPTGVGEPGVPPIGPAVANAVFALTGQRVRSLPFARHEFAGS